MARFDEDRNQVLACKANHQLRRGGTSDRSCRVVLVILADQCTHLGRRSPQCTLSQALPQV